MCFPCRNFWVKYTGKKFSAHLWGRFSLGGQSTWVPTVRRSQSYKTKSLTIPDASPTNTESNASRYNK